MLMNVKEDRAMKKTLLLLLFMMVTQGAWAQSTSDIGKVLGADGKMYKTVAAATNAGTTASGIIAYWGAAGSVESGNSSYRGMAIALEDASLNWGEHPDHTNYCTSDNHHCSTATSYCSTVSTALNAINGIAATQSAKDNNTQPPYHNAPCNGYNVARPSGASMWAIPSVGQWKLMAQGLTGKSSDLSDTDNPDYTYDKLSAKITAAGGNTLQWLLYWSSTEQDASKAWTFDLGGINSDRNGSRFNAIAKNHDNQYMHVRMFFAFSSATAAVYTISYNANGGSDAPSSQTKDGGIDLTLSSTVPTRLGYSFVGWNTNADGSGTSYASGATFTGNANATLYAQWTPDPTHFSQDGDVYTIHTATGWGVFCDLLDEGESFSGKTIRLGADISVTRMAGSSGKDFYGTFDGQGNTLTVNITGSRDYCGTFFYVKSATIRNLKLAGTISSAYKYAGSIIGGSEGTVSISNCQSSVTIRSSVSGDGTHGGLVGRMGDSNTLSIEGCVFTGKLLYTCGTATNYCGGFVGWSNSTVNISNSLYAPANIEEGENEVGAGTGNNPSKTFVRNGGSVNITNSYYTRALGTAQGTSATPTSNKPANLGVKTSAYSVSGITSYTNGLYRNGQYYCGSPEYNYTLSTTPATVLGESKYVTTFYHGTLDYQLPDGALAYTAGKVDGKVVFYRIGTNSNVIPKNTAVIIVADSSADITLTKLPSTDVTPKAGNILRGSDVEITKPSGTVYVLGVVGSVLGFYPFTEGTIPAGKAYYIEN